MNQHRNRFEEKLGMVETAEGRVKDMGPGERFPRTLEVLVRGARTRAALRRNLQ